MTIGFCNLQSINFIPKLRGWRKSISAWTGSGWGWYADASVTWKKFWVDWHLNWWWSQSYHLIWKTDPVTVPDRIGMKMVCAYSKADVENPVLSAKLSAQSAIKTALAIPKTTSRSEFNNTLMMRSSSATTISNLTPLPITSSSACSIQKIMPSKPNMQSPSSMQNLSQNWTQSQHQRNLGLKIANFACKKGSK